MTEDELYDRIEDLEAEIEYLKGRDVKVIRGLTKNETALASMLFSRSGVVGRELLIDLLLEEGYTSSEDERMVDVMMTKIRKIFPKGSFESVWSEGIFMTEIGREWYRQETEGFVSAPNEEDFQKFLERRKFLKREIRCDDKFTEEEDAYIRHLSYKTTAEGASRRWKNIFGRPRTTVTLMDQAARLGVMFKPPKVERKYAYNADQECFLRMHREQGMTFKEIAYAYNKRYGTDHDFTSLRNHFKAMGLGSKHLFRMKDEYKLEAHRRKHEWTSKDFRLWVSEQAGIEVNSAVVAHMCRQEGIEFFRRDGRGKRWSKKPLESE